MAGEIETQMRRHGARAFYVADPYAGEDHLAAVATEVLSRGLDIRFQVMGRPVAAFDEELLDLLARAGCRWISWGVESGSKRLLDIAGKGTDPETIRRVLERSGAAGISNLLLMLFGLPGSTDLDLWRTIGLLDDVWDLVDSVTASTFALYAEHHLLLAAERFERTRRPPARAIVTAL